MPILNNSLYTDKKFRERKINLTKLKDIAVFLEGIYNEKTLKFSQDMPLNEFNRVNSQINKLCQIMKNYGFKKFLILNTKFDIKFTIFLNSQSANRTKELMEDIVYRVKNTPENQRHLMAEFFKDKSFICGPGIETNLQNMLKEMSNRAQNIDHLIGAAKKDIAQNVILNMLGQKLFGKKFYKDSGMEVHQIKPLINVIADDFGLVKFPLENDVHSLSEEDALPYKNMISKAVKRALNKRLIDAVAMNVRSQFHDIREGQNAQEIVESLNKDLADLRNIISYQHLMKIDRNYHISAEYKDNIDEIILRSVKIYFHDQNLKKSENIEFHRIISKIDKSVTVNKDIFDLNEAKEPLKIKVISYIMKNKLEIDADDFGTANIFQYFTSEYNQSTHGSTELLNHIIKESNIEMLHSYIDIIDNLDSIATKKDSSGLTAMHWAVKSNNKENIIALLDSAQKKNNLLMTRNKQGETPLQHATKEHHTNSQIEIMKIIFETGSLKVFEANFPESRKFYKKLLQFIKNPFHNAKDPEINMYLIDKDTGNSYLHMAAKTGNKRIYNHILNKCESSTMFNLMNRQREKAPNLIDLNKNNSIKPIRFSDHAIENYDEDYCDDYQEYSHQHRIRLENERNHINTHNRR